MLWIFLFFLAAKRTLNSFWPGHEDTGDSGCQLEAWQVSPHQAAGRSWPSSRLQTGRWSPAWLGPPAPAPPPMARASACPAARQGTRAVVRTRAHGFSRLSRQPPRFTARSPGRAPPQGQGCAVLTDWEGPCLLSRLRIRLRPGCHQAKAFAVTAPVPGTVMAPTIRVVLGF